MKYKAKSTIIPVSKLPEEQQGEIKNWVKQGIPKNSISTTKLEQMLIENQLALCELVELIARGDLL